MKKLLIILFLFAITSNLFGLNNKCGISISFPGSTENTDYVIEQLYYDPIVDDHSVVVVKDSAAFTISLAHNGNNTDFDGNTNPSPEGNIRCMMDGDELYRYDYSSAYLVTDTESFAESEGVVWPYNNTTFTIAEKSKGVGEQAAPSQVNPERHYHYGSLDDFGDEWHTLTYWDDDKTDAKIIHFIVNPKTPAISFSASGSEQYYTRPAKAYYNPVIRTQTTFLTSGVNITFRNMTNATTVIEYRASSGDSWTTCNVGDAIAASTIFSGSNTEYDFEFRIQNESEVRTRKIHYIPNSPSASETHPILLFSNAAQKNEISTKIGNNTPVISFPSDDGTITIPSYQSRYNSMKNAATNDFSTDYRSGLRIYDPYAGNEASFAAFVWQMENDSTYADHAKEILLSFTYDLIGACFYYQERIVPEFEVGKNWRNINWMFAYDLLVGYSGMTAIEEYKIRDNLANMIRTLLLRSWYMNDHNHLFNTYNMVAAAAVAMPTYDTVFGHATNADRSGNDATSLQPSPSWFNAVYNKNTNLNAPGNPGYSLAGLWGRFMDSGICYESLEYVPYYFYPLMPQYGLFRLHHDNVNIFEQEDRFRNFPLHIIYTRRPSDGRPCPYNHIRRGFIPTQGTYFWPYINKVFDVEYVQGKKLNELCKWNYELLKNNYSFSSEELYHSERFDNDIMLEYFSLYDDTIPAETNPKNKMFFQAGFSFYSDITSPDSLFLYQHGEEDLHANDYFMCPDSLMYTIEGFGERFTASIDEYRNDVPSDRDMNRPYYHNNIVVDYTDFSEIDVIVSTTRYTQVITCLGKHTETYTSHLFENNYLNYGCVKTRQNSPLDTGNYYSYFSDRLEQRRHFFIPDNRYFVLVDQIRSLDGSNHTYDWMFNGLGTVTRSGNNNATVSKGSGNPKLNVYLSGSDHTLTDGSFLAGTGYVRAAKSSRQNADYLAVFYPVDGGGTEPAVTDISAAGYLASEITDDNGTAYVFAQINPASIVIGTATTDATMGLVKFTSGNLDYFQMNNCTNITIDDTEFLNSTERINFSLKLANDGYVYQIQPDNPATASTQLTIGGLTPSITYTLTDNEFTDYYNNKTQVAQFTFQSDANGKYTYTQNCSRHEITIQSGDHVPVVINNPGGGSGSNDSTAPEISNVRITGIGSNRATVTWTTDEEASSRIEYGIDASYGSTSSLNDELAESHSVTLTGLSAGTQYHIRALSADASGNGALSSNYTFTTAVDEAEAKSWPNPYEYSENNPMTFEFPGVDNGGTIKMYTIAGKLIKTIELPVGEIRIQWDGKDENGFVVASGLYLYVLTTSEGKIRKGKFAFVK